MPAAKLAPALRAFPAPSGGAPLRSFSLSPAGPYAIGTTSVTLTVSDPYGAFSTCTATITVQELTPPTIVCPANITTVTALITVMFV